MITVRDFEHRDVAPANALTNFHIQHTTAHFGLEPAADADFEHAWRKGSDTHPWLVAELDGQFAGYAKAGVWRERGAYRNTCETGIYVERHAQGRGVGRAMYQHLLSRLASEGYHAVVAGMSLPNPGSVALHESVGFRHVGIFREVGDKHGARRDIGFWQINLDEPTRA